MQDFITVVLPTHAPDIGRMERVLGALAIQNYPRDRWELLVVDNASPLPVTNSLAVTGHPDARLLQENQLGLSHARIAGINAASGNIIIFVDDDNLLQPDYLTEAARFLSEHSTVAAIGGIIEAEFATPPPAWTFAHLSSLAIRNYGPASLISDYAPAGDLHAWPYFAPVGAGLVVRTEAARQFVGFFTANPAALSDRKGKSLGSAGDCELILHAAFLAGLQVAYCPGLRLIHLIPTRRLTFWYLTRLAYQSGISWGKFQATYGFKEQIAFATLLLRLPRAFWHRTGWTRQGFVGWASTAGEFIGRTKRS